MDFQAVEACRQNVNEQCEKAEDVPAIGGNVAKYQEIAGAKAST